jgi:hypothetical protein
VKGGIARGRRLAGKGAESFLAPTASVGHPSKHLVSHLVRGSWRVPCARQSAARALLRAPSGPAHPGATACAASVGRLARGSRRASLAFRRRTQARSCSTTDVLLMLEAGMSQDAQVTRAPGSIGSHDPFGVVRGRPVDSEKARAFSSSPSRPRPRDPGDLRFQRYFEVFWVSGVPPIMDWMTEVL